MRQDDDQHTAIATENSPQPEAAPQRAPAPKEHAPIRNTVIANKTFNFFNYFGLGFVANSVMSLAITWNVMPTEGAKKFKAAIGNGIAAVAKSVDKMQHYIGVEKSEADLAKRALSITESSRSVAEIMCMFVAGCLVLLPMKYLENHKKGFVDKVDQWWNKDYHAYAKANNITPEALPCEHEAKQTWANLLGARVGGMVAILGLDAAIQGFNNKRANANKSNLDTAEWAIGGIAYDLLPEKFTKRVVNFFTSGSRAHETGLHNIQGQLLKNLEATVGNNPDKMLFAEQTRLVSKEVSLTLIMAGLIYTLSKAGLMSTLFKKMGITKPEDQRETIDTMLKEVPFVPITRGDIELGATQPETPHHHHAGDEQEAGGKLAEKYANTRREAKVSTPQGGYIQKAASTESTTSLPMRG